MTASASTALRLPAPGAPRQRMARSVPAHGLKGACEFSDDRDLMNARWVVRQMKRFVDLWRPIRHATDRAYAGRGRKGYIAGDWAHVFAVFTLSDTPYLSTFWEDQQESSLWQEAAFDDVPSFNCLEQNFRRLEACAPVIEAAAYRLMRIAEACEPRVNLDWDFDATAYHSPCQVEHCCPGPNTCAAQQKNGSKYKPPRYLEKATDQEVTSRRHAEQRGPEPGAPPPAPDAGGPKTPKGSSRKGRKRDKRDAAALKPEFVPLADGELPEFERDPKYTYQWLRWSDGTQHLYRSLDTTAAGRAYTGPGRKVRSWFGGLAMAGIDSFTGAVNGVHLFPANEQEYHHYPKLYAKVEAGLGHGPRAMVADRGLHTKGVFEHNTRRGVGTIIPWREPRSGVRRRDMRRDEFDEHGVPRCQHCGGAGTTARDGGGILRRQGLGFYLADGEPRIRYICSLGTTEACRREEQSIACATEWRMLLPVSLTEKVYYALKNAHSNHENVFYAWRHRYNVAANDKSSQPRVRRRQHLELRASFALLLEWFRLCVRHGWLAVPGHGRKNTQTPFERPDRGWLKRVFAARKRRGTDLPYGRYMERCQLLAGMPTANGPPGDAEADTPPDAN